MTCSTITLSNGKVVRVSEELYINTEPNFHSRIPILWRMIAGCDDVDKMGYHPMQSQGWYCFIPLKICLDGVSEGEPFVECMSQISNRLYQPIP